MPHKIAVASSNGKYIDLHFAQAEKFYIYHILDNTYKFMEIREKSAPAKHDENEFDKALLLLDDCTAVFVSRVGYGAAKYLAAKGMRVFEAPYSIDEVLTKIISQKILQEESTPLSS